MLDLASNEPVGKICNSCTQVGGMGGMGGTEMHGKHRLPWEHWECLYYTVSSHQCNRVQVPRHILCM